GRHDPWPGDREAIRLQAEVAHQGDVVFPTVVVIGRDVAGVAVADLAGRVAETIPDRLAAAVFFDGALDLVRRRGCPEDEPAWESLTQRLRARRSDRVGLHHGLPCWRDCVP